MNVETFCEHFATFADAPNGIEKLRELILQLAVQGKLVPQDKNDEPASEVVRRINASRGMKNAAHGSAAATEGLPQGWILVRMGQITDHRLGKMLDKAKNKGELFPYLRNTNVQWWRFALDDLKEMRFVPDELREYEVRIGDLLVCEGGEPGRCAVWNDTTHRLVFQKAIHRVRPLEGISPYFLAIRLRLDALTGVLDRQFTGATIKHFTGQELARYEFPLPPIAEQRRIVEKVDQLLGLCDELAARQAAQREKRQRLVGATLDRLVSCRRLGENVWEGEAPAEPQSTRISGQTARQEPRPPGMQSDFETHAHRLRNHFDQLFDTPTTIPQLRRTILQLAVQGQLVQQDPKDEPAIETVRRLEHERQVMIADGKMREEKLLLPTVDASTSPMPRGWADVRLGYVINCLDHIRRPVSKEERETKRGKYPYYGANGQVGWIDDFLFDEDLVLVVEDESFIGRVKPFSYKITGKTWVNNHAHVLQPTFAVDVDFLNYALSFYPFTPLTSGTTNRKKLTKVGLLNAPLQLPPVPEQKRIACKVTELLSLCDALEAKLTQTESASTQLLSAAVHHLLNGEAANV